MSNSADLDKWSRRLREQMATASATERPAIILRAVETAKPFIRAKTATRKEVIDILEACSREHGLTALKAANDTARAKGLFAGPPFHDGPEAA